MTRRPALGVLALTLLTAACGYALAGRGNALPDHIKRIGVPTFTNLSDTPELDRILTEAVRQELLGKGRYTVVPDSTGVDAVLSGTVRPVSLRVASVTDSRQAQRYLITIEATVEFKDLRETKVLWSNPNLRVSDDYEVTGSTTVSDPAAVFSQDQNALTRLAKSFARTLVTSILEAF
jgi:outer membrane lipopolysaccharide assembly protein LptE/RlpB